MKIKPHFPEIINYKLLSLQHGKEKGRQSNTEMDFESLIYIPDRAFSPDQLHFFLSTLHQYSLIQARSTLRR